MEARLVEFKCCRWEKQLLILNQTLTVSLVLRDSNPCPEAHVKMWAVEPLRFRTTLRVDPPQQRLGTGSRTDHVCSSSSLRVRDVAVGP